MRMSRSPWITCAACALLMFCVVGLSASTFGVYQPYLISIVGLSNTQASSVVSCRILSSIPAIYFVQRYLRFMGLRRGVSFACFLSAGAFFLFGRADSFLDCCLAAALHGISYGFGGMIATSIIIKQAFSRHQALALGLCSAGTGVAALLIPPVITGVVEAYSLRSAMWTEAGFIAAASLLIFILLGLGPKLSAHTALPARSEPQVYTPRERSAIRCILPAIVIIGTIGVGGWSHLTVLYTTEGMPAAAISWFISFAGLALAAGQCLIGQLADRVGGKKAVLFCSVCLVAGLGLACLAALQLPAVIAVSMLCLGFGIPLSVVGLSVFASDLVEPERYATTLRNFQLVYRTGSLVFEPVPGIIADLTGSYVPAYCGLAVFSVLSLLLISRAYRVQSGG